MNRLNKEELIETIASLEFCRENNFVTNDNIVNNTNAIVKLRKQLKYLEDKKND